ncbi:protein phosphatase regulatory subunit Sds22 [Savitreella phatthalungensis]
MAETDARLPPDDPQTDVSDTEDAADAAPTSSDPTHAFGGDVDRPLEVIAGESLEDDTSLLSDLPSNTVDVECVHRKIGRMDWLGLCRFTRMERLCLRQNTIREIAGLPDTPTLTELDLYDNLITEPANLNHQTNLVSLDLSFNKIKHLAHHLHNLTNLQELYLVQNKIAKVGDGLRGLIGLRMIELGGNRLRGLEGLEGLKGLEELWLGKNKITAFGEYLKEFPKLRLLSIQSNRLTDLAGLHYVKDTLKELYISHNGLTNLDGIDACTRLEVLDVSNNRLTTIEGVGKLEGLKEFWASNNGLESFDEVEKECGHLVHLDTVYFEGNPLQLKNPTTYRNKVKLALHNGLKQIDANMIRA